MSNRIIIVGGGLSGLMSAVKAAEAGYSVDLFSLVPVRRSHSVCAQGGINGCVQPTREGDSPDEHFDDTVYGGDFLANQTPVRNMCHAAPAIIKLMDRMGVMFNRTPEGNLDFRAFGGAKYRRTAFAGATTGQQLLYALDEQVRRFEVAGKVTKYEFWDFLGAVVDDDGICRGISAMNLRSMEIRTFAADAVIVATGGPGVIFGKSTNSAINTGAAAASLYAQGVRYANGEFIQVHPTAIQGIDKLRLMSESARGEGGRIWTLKDGKPWYFLEEKYPAYGNLVPRDIATREIFHVCVDEKLGIDGKNQVYLDLTHLPADYLDRKLGGLPGGPLLHGRHVGRLRPDDQHPRTVCRGRVRLSIPRRQPSRGQCAPFLHLFRNGRGTGRSAFCQGAEKGCRGRGSGLFRQGAAASGGGFRGNIPDERSRKSLSHGAGVGRTDDRKRDRGALQ